MEGEHISNQVGLPPDHYLINVTSIKTPTYAELCTAYDHVCIHWDETDSILELHESLQAVEPTIGEKVVFLKKFDGKATGKRVVAWAEKNGYRLAFPAEREAFAKVNPELQLQLSLIHI